jgi:hypothetical protein
VYIIPRKTGDKVGASTAAVCFLGVIPSSLAVKLASKRLRKAPGEGLEPSSPEGHQLARHDLRLIYDLEADPF